MIRLELHRNSGDYGFEIKDSLNHLIQTDSSSKDGGNDNGFRPMQLVLAALGSCSAIDIVSILKKQRQELSDLSIVIEGEREQDVIPSLWKKIALHFTFKGTIDSDKATRAVELSVQKYCSVAETLRRAGTEITWTVNNFNAEKINL